MTDAEKQQKAKEVADRLKGDVIAFDFHGLKYVYHKGMWEKEQEFEKKRKEQLYKETGNPIFLL